MTAQIQTVISYLNEPPFKCNLTLIAFDSKTMAQLINIVAVVCSEIDPAFKKTYAQAADEDDDDDDDELGNNPHNNNNNNGSHRTFTSGKMSHLLSFLKLLNYKPLIENERTFAMNDSEIICEVLFWLLTRMTDLKTRAYVAKYLNSYELPNEFLVDPIISDLSEQLQQQKQVFKETHLKLSELESKEHESNRNAASLAFLKQEKKQLFHEKQQLIEKLNQMKHKINVDESSKNKKKFNELLQMTSELRKFQEEEQVLYERNQEQRIEHRMNQKFIRELNREKYDLQTIDLAHIETGDDIVHEFQAKCAQTQKSLAKLDAEYDENHELLSEALNIINSNPVSCAELQAVEKHLLSISDECQMLENERDALLESVDQKLSFYKKRTIAIAKKKESAISKLEALKEECMDARNDVLLVEDAMDKLEIINGRRAMGERELKQYMKELRLKTETYKRCKQQLQLERNELMIVQRTNEILRHRHPSLAQYLQDMDNDQRLQTEKMELEAVSSVKNQLDVSKERTLTSLAAVVNEIQSKLNLKRHKLQPLVKQLKQKRKNFQVFEANYKQSSNIYRNMKIGYENEYKKIETNVHSLLKIVQNLESRYFKMKTEYELKQIRLEKVQNEAKYQNSASSASAECRLDSQFQCYRDLYDAQISKLLTNSKSLRNEQKNVRKNFEIDSVQTEYFQHLLEIMKLKESDIQTRLQQVVHIMDDDEGAGADRMVFVD